MKKAVVLLSGGLDSATTLYFAKEQGFKCFCLIFDYGQRHKKEIESARRIAQTAHCHWQIIKINLPWKGSSLLDKKLNVPQRYNTKMAKRNPSTSSGLRPEFIKGRNNAIPSTYVPARNIIFLSFALSFAEAMGAKAIFIGAHSQDYSGYPDCRPEFYQAFSKVIIRGTKTGVEKKRIRIQTPLIHKTKAQIIRLGSRLGVPFELTWSCYRGGKRPCGKCDSCYYRAKGFNKAGIKDPIN